MTDKQICDRIKGALSASMMPMEMELECNRFLDRCLDGRWIPVEERLPTEEDADETHHILAIHKDEGWVQRWLWDIVARYPTEFTHWMPLPEPPGKDVDGNA